MDKTSLINKVKEFGLNTREEYMAEALSRNIGLLTQAEQDKLSNARIYGAPGQNLLRFAGTIDHEDLMIIEQTIKEGCEKVNLDEGQYVNWG
jgi:hypothetical protein